MNESLDDLESILREDSVEDVVILSEQGLFAGAANRPGIIKQIAHDHLEFEKMSLSSSKLDSDTLSNLEKAVSSSDNSDDQSEMSESWANNSKHIFIMSNAGKPIYSHHGSEENLVTMYGIMQALISVVDSFSDKIQSITVGSHIFVFLIRNPLYLVGVSSLGMKTNQLEKQLEYVYNFIVSTLTSTQLTRVFQRRNNFDLRSLLVGTERFMASLIDYTDVDPGFLVNAVQCVPLSGSTRDLIGQTLQIDMKDLVFCIMSCDNKLIQFTRLRNYTLHPSDLHILFNLISNTRVIDDNPIWMPICLPGFDSSGYLHGLLSYLDPENRICLTLLSVNQDLFHPLLEAKQNVQARLIKTGCISAIEHSLEKSYYSVVSTGLPHLRHFIYKRNALIQFTAPIFEVPYESKSEQQRLMRLYASLHSKLHHPVRPIKLIYKSLDSETFLAWMTSSFELYCCFSPLVSKGGAIDNVNRLLRWIKKEENRLYILNSYTF